MAQQQQRSRNNSNQQQNQNAQKPVASFGPYWTNGSTNIKVAVWENQVNHDGKQVPVFAVTIQRSYRDDQGWHESKSFWVQDLPVLVHALNQAHAWILEQRSGQNQQS